jgi:hypothetical protein
LFLVGALGVSLSRVASGQDRAMRIRNLDVQLAVNADGSLDVTERQSIRFTGRWSRIQRDLLLRSPTDGGPWLQISRVSATDGDGQPLRTEVYSGHAGGRATDGYRHVGIWLIPNPVNEDRAVILRYHVMNAIRFDQLLWTINGGGDAIDKVNVVVVLPTEAAPTRAAVYTHEASGKYFIPAFHPGARVMTDATIETNRKDVGISLPRAVPRFEIVTVLVDLPPGLIQLPIKAPERPGISPVQWWPVLIPLLIFVAAFRTWQRREDPGEAPSLAPYAPAADMSPAELGTLVDDTVDGVDLTATLVDLAARGFLRIEEKTERPPGELAMRTDHIIHIICTRQYGVRLKEHERLFLQTLSNAAGTSKQVRNSRLRRELVWPKEIRDAIYDSLISSGYYFARPDKVKNSWKAAAAFTAVLGIPLVFLAFRYPASLIAPVPVTTAAVLSAFILFLFSRIMPARTPAGTHTREAALDLKSFLTRVKDPHNTSTMSSPEMFERYFPYAIALGAADSWSKAFDDLYGAAPRWYVGGTGPFKASSFSRSIGSMSRVA